MPEVLNTFEIVVQRRGTKLVFRMPVDHLYSSPQLQRFKVYGSNGKYMIFEKHTHGKVASWKVPEGLPTGLKKDDEFQAAAMAIFDMENKLDDYLSPRLKDMEAWAKERNIDKQ